MGNLTVSNVFKQIDLGSKSEMTHQPVVDEMDVELQNFKLSR